ncbi:hypothetical protein EIP91_010046 [Steccherinum ochraceum]|uniref:AB hydrolase-1 domain-containing protein n=1 Tax=Steccherinum ochraceum TaxID=92696 RepID=A0A4R0R0Y7_9APHY|nr:hypothetical protein EIP91_010046 [Steccherinum ochraceum]
MPELPVKNYGKFAIHDTGAPAGKDDYITLVLVHGYAWHSGVFNRLVPFVPKYGLRLVLVNRRDYPSAAPYTEEELDLLKAGSAQTPEAAESVREYIKGRGKDLYEFLELFIAQENVPKKSGDTGGIIVGGWSFGTIFITALLANGSSFAQGKVDIPSYLRCILNYDPPYHVLGYPTLEGGYNPLVDDSVTREEGAKQFPRWVSGYYAHGDSPATLELRNPQPHPPSTIETMAPEDIHSALYPGPGNPGGSDALLMNIGIQHGAFADSRKKAYLLGPEGEDKSGWDDVKLRHVWCDQTVWEAPYAMYCLKDDAKAAQKDGKRFRSHEIVRMEKANHFIHWDEPERTLATLLGVDLVA